MKQTTEARRALSRIGSNYVRLGISVVLGLAIVPLLLGRLGQEAYGLIGLLGSTVGIAAIAQQIVNESMVRELGQAYHRSRDDFVATYNTALLLCLAVTGISAALFAVVWLVIPLLEIPPDLIAAARVFVVAKGVETAVVIALAPFQRMYVVSERMVWANLWLLADHVARLLATLWIITLASRLAAPDALVAYVWIASSVMIVSVIASAVILTALEPATIPRPGRATRAAARSILTVGGYNVLTQLASNMHERFGQILMNLFLGLRFNAVFAIALILASYTRVLATGMTAGVDAVATRLSSKASGGQLAVLLRHSTRLHALITLPAAAGVFILADVIIEVWLGSRLPDPEAAAMTAVLVRLVVLGVATRAISDGWLKILYGAGHIRRYAPVVVAAGLANPIVAIILLLTLPERIQYVGPAVSFAVVLVIVNLGFIPRITARTLGLPLRDVLGPIARPAIATIGIVPILAAPRLVIADWDLLSLGAVAVTAGAAYAGLTWMVVVAPSERQRVRAALSRRLRPAQ